MAEKLLLKMVLEARWLDHASDDRISFREGCVCRMQKQVPRSHDVDAFEGIS